MARHLLRRDTLITDTETSPFSHKFLIRRPVIKEHFSSTSTSSTIANGTTTTSPSHHELQHSLTPGAPTPTGCIKDEENDNPWLEKRRFELFIDLTWVGIIGNLADNFNSEAFGSNSVFSIGRAVANFILLFLMAWRLWKFLQTFMSKYHTGDLIERFFIVWILFLALLFGNNAPYLLIPGPEQSSLAVIAYLIARSSFLLLDIVYSIYLPSLRRGVLVRALTALPLAGIWIAMICVPRGIQLWLLIAVDILESLLATAVDTPLLGHYLREERAKPQDPEHWVERTREFFVIILGDGVMNLIRGSPIGRGLTPTMGVGVCALLVYYNINAYYFHGDLSRRYIHAVRRTWWRKELWQFWHIVMFHSTLIISVGVAFFLANPEANAVTPTKETDGGVEPSEEMLRLARNMYTAKWVVAVSFATTVLSLTIIALLSKSLDEPGTCKVQNRYVRLGPRLGLVVVALLLPLHLEMAGSLYLTTVAMLMWAVLIWEWVATLEKGGGLLEP